MRQSLFPLHTVLFPGSRLPLQIFEQRYLSLVTESLREQNGFVTVLISDGKEVGGTPKIYSTGCYVDIIDWETLENGLLGITIEARYRVNLTDPGVKDNGLLTAEATEIESPGNRQARTEIILPEHASYLAETLQQLLQHPFTEKQYDDIDFKSAHQVCYRLCELLPINNEQKQILLEVPSINELIDQVSIQINTLQK